MHVADLVAERIRDAGPIGFDELMELALYVPGAGFFEAVGSAGRRQGDFVTSVEVGPLFGAVVARRIDAAWRQLGEPDPFTVVDAGAGRGTLALSVLAAEPACADALRYVMVERSVELHTRQHERLDRDPRVSGQPDLPDEPLVGVVVANELLDNLPTRLLERRSTGWVELLVDVVDDHLGLVPSAEAFAHQGEVDELAPDATEGARVPWQEQAVAWTRRALGLVEAGSVIVLDYARDTAALADRPMGEWLRTYRGHERGVDPLEALGQQDITCDVAVDQLAAGVSPPTVDVDQATWLRLHGIDELVDEGRRAWDERAHIGDLAAVKARSRITEADALTDPSGLGAFRVLEWTR